MNPVRLDSNLFATTSVIRVENLPSDLMVNGVSIDSRTLRSGELFIAIHGDRYDGHRFIGPAIEKGACAVVIDEKNDLQFLEKNFPRIVVKDTLNFLMEFAGWYRRRFLVPVIGITGSTGKTTVKEMTAAILATQYKVNKTEGNKNNFIGVSLTLFCFDSKTEVGIIEMGTNHPGEIAKLTAIVQPTHAAITNIGSGHIGNFGSIEAIYQEKISLLHGMKKNGVYYRNCDDPLLREYHNNNIKIIDFGLTEKAAYKAKYLGTNGLGKIRFQFSNGPEIQLHIPGKHHLSNALLAATIGYDFGITQEQVKSGLEKVLPVDKRMEYFREGGILFINDTYNSNPDSLRAAIDFLCELPLPDGNKRFLVVGDMLELGNFSEKFHRQIGEYLSDKPIDVVLGFGEKSKIICQSVAERASQKKRAKWFPDYMQIAEAIRTEATAGDIVLLKGSRGMAIENVLKYLTRRD